MCVCVCVCVCVPASDRMRIWWGDNRTAIGTFGFVHVDTHVEGQLEDFL